MRVPSPRVGILVEDLEGGGAEKIAMTVANELARQGVVVEVIMKRAEGPFVRELLPEISKIDISTEAGSSGYFSVIQFLIRYFKSYPPDVLLTHMEKPSLLAILAGLVTGFKKIIPVVHTNIVTYARLEHSLRRTLLMYLVKFAYPLAHGIIAISDGAAAEMRLLLGSRKDIHVVKNGFCLDTIRARAAEEPAVLWFSQKTQPVIVACGRLVPYKDHATLIRAFALLRSKVAARLVILGEGPMRQELTRLIARLNLQNDVSLPGFIPNPIACFARADLFVLPSRVEGLSNVLIEAMAVGVPIVSTDCPTGPREVLVDGKFGTLVPVADAAAMAAAMHATLQRSKTAPDIVLRHHLQQYTVDTMMAGYSKVLATRDS